MLKLLSIILCAISILTGCATTSNSPKMSNEPLYALDTVAISTSENIHTLSAIQTAGLKDQSSAEQWREFMFNLQAIPKSLSQRKSFEFVGTVQDAVKGIADLSNFSFYLIGKAPAQPLIVSIKSTNNMLIDDLRDINAQINNKAIITLSPESKVMTLTFKQQE